jgi:hypothetical protein
MAYPILVCSDRIAKALMDEKSEIDAVYMTLPTADVIQ